MSKLAIYRVMPTDNGWTYTVNDVASTFFAHDSEQEAIEAAKKDAQEAAQKGYTATVMVKTGRDDWRTAVLRKAHRPKLPAIFFKLQIDDSVFATAEDVLAHTSQVGADVVITVDTSDTITLQHMTLASLHASDVVIG